MSRKHILIGPALLIMMLWDTTSDASLELLAGVEAGIETITAMTSSDLTKTQHILSNRKIGDRIAWHNPDTGTSYQIEIDDHFTFNNSPCVSYKLTMQHNGKTQVKPLDACLNSAGHWISVNAGTTAL